MAHQQKSKSKALRKEGIHVHIKEFPRRLSARLELMAAEATPPKDRNALILEILEDHAAAVTGGTGRS